jgi:hypothetical protein
MSVLRVRVAARTFSRIRKNREANHQYRPDINYRRIFRTCDSCATTPSPRKTPMLLDSVTTL